MRNGHGGEIGYFVIGALLGGAVAALTTPYSGRRMRRAMLRKVEDGSDQLGEIADSFRKQCAALSASGEQVLNQARKMAQFGRRERTT